MTESEKTAFLRGFVYKVDKMGAYEVDHQNAWEVIKGILNESPILLGPTTSVGMMIRKDPGLFAIISPLWQNTVGNCLTCNRAAWRHNAAYGGECQQFVGKKVTPLKRKDV